MSERTEVMVEMPLARMPSPDEASDLLAGLLDDAVEQGYELEWSTPEDLARLSVEAMIESQRGEFSGS